MPSEIFFNDMMQQDNTTDNRRYVKKPRIRFSKNPEPATRSPVF
jgi:hypothetical protein